MKKEFKFQFILCCIITTLLIFISTKIQFTFDFSKNKVYSLSEYTKEIFSSVDSSIKIQWIRSKSVNNYLARIKYVEILLNQFAQTNNCIFEIVDAETLSSTALNSLQLYPEQFTSTSQNSQTNTTVYSGLIIEYKGLTKIIPYIFDVQNLEYTITNNVFALIQDSENTFDKRQIYILTFTNALQEDYMYLLPFLEYENIICKIVNDEDISQLDPSIPLVVIGSHFLTDEQIAEVDNFLQAGGNAAFFVSGNSIAVNGNWAVTPKTNDKLISLLADYGFIIGNDLLVDIFHFPLNMMSEDGRTNQVIQYPYWIRINPEQVDIHQSFFSGYNTLQMFWPSSLDLNISADKTLQPVIITSRQAKRLIENIITDPFLFSENDISNITKNSYTLAATSTKDRKLFVLADEYFLSRCIEFTNSDTNIQTFVSICQWLLGNENILYLKNKQSIMPSFKTFEDQSTLKNKILFARILNIGLVPCIIICIAIFILFSKRNMREKK